MITTSLNQIRAFGPCASGWTTLLKAVGKTEADDVQIPLDFILQSNGIRDTIWCFRVSWFEHKRLYMEFVDACAWRAKMYADDAAAAYAAYVASAASAASAAAAAADYAAYAAAYVASAASAADYASAYERQFQKDHLIYLLNYEVTV